jgi:hypothetical protein
MNLEEFKAEVENAGFKYDARALGELIGQFSAESSKNGKLIDFSNKIISEHAIFLENANKIGLSSTKKWRATLQYNPKRISKEEREHLMERFSHATGISKVHLARMPKGNYCFAIELWDKPLVDRVMTLFWSTLNLMAKAELKGELKILAEHFLAKLLAEDGYAKTELAGKTTTKKREKRRLRVNIGEGNSELRRLYKEIIEKLGITSRIDDKYNIVILNTNWEILLSLCKTQAFKGHLRNRAKVIYAFLKHPKTRYLYDRLSLAKEKPICSGDLIKSIKESKKRRNRLWVVLRWIKSKVKEGYLVRTGKKGRYSLFELTDKGRHLLKTVDEATKELKLLKT